MTLRRTFALAGVLATAPVRAGAAPVIYAGVLSGPAESPANGSPGTGLAVVTIDTIANSMRVQVSFSDLLGPTTASHIHCCTPAPGSGTAAVATTTPTFPDFPPGATSGSYDHTFDMTQASSYNSAYVTNSGGISAAEAALFAGVAADQAYLNVHTTTYPGGEIRAFLIPDVIFRSGLEAP